MEDLVEKCNYKTRISSTPKRLATSPSIPTYQPFSFLALTLVQTNGADYQPVNKKIDNLIEMMKGLAHLVWTLQNNTGLCTENI